MATADKGTPSVRADYLRGDPQKEGPIARGRLEAAPRGIRFSGPEGADLEIDLRAMEALTVSGRSPYEHPRHRSQRGTMLIAARRGSSVEVWEFAVERKSGAVLRDWINRELHLRGLRRPPLPFVEQLVGPVPPAGDDPTAADQGRNHARRGFSLRRWHVALLGFLISAVIGAELLIVLALIR
jgi:hypothetical protein